MSCIATIIRRVIRPSDYDFYEIRGGTEIHIAKMAIYAYPSHPKTSITVVFVGLKGFHLVLLFNSFDVVSRLAL